MSKHWFFFQSLLVADYYAVKQIKLKFCFEPKIVLTCSFGGFFFGFLVLVCFFLIEMMHYTLKKFIYSLDENITLSHNPTALPVL